MNFRRILLVGEINEELYRSFSSKLRQLEIEDVDAPITLELNSEGGIALVALAITGRMRESPCLIEVVVHGAAQSAASLILASGDIRKMSSEAWAMVHEDRGSMEDGTIEEMEKRALHYRRLENQWAELMAERTNTSFKAWVRLHKDETYLTAKQCLELGMIDEVI
jgi:ATP-dependent Clp protease protease subunit